MDLDPHVSTSWDTSPAEGALSHSPSHLSTHLQNTLSLSLHLSRIRKNTRTRERKEWRRDWRRRGVRRREVSAPSHGVHKHLQHSHGEPKRIAVILWIFPKVVNVWFLVGGWKWWGLDGTRVGSSIFWLWKLLILDPRISISISRFISYLMSFGLISMPLATLCETSLQPSHSEPSKPPKLP